MRSLDRTPITSARLGMSVPARVALLERGQTQGDGRRVFAESLLAFTSEKP